MTMKVRIDRDLCIGVGNCVAVAPAVFQMDKENKAVVLDSASVDDETLKLAASSCPTLAVVLEDEDGLQLYP